MNASEAKRDAQHRALRWSHALSRQVDRLHADRAEALESQEKVRAAAFYGHDDAWPFHMMEADKHFALVAARQLLRALRAFDGNDRLPDSLPEGDVRLVRDALEHWDEPDGFASSKMRTRGADPGAHSWRRSGPGVLGDLIDDTALRAWATSVYGELVNWDPW
jgi:hypothetical protein